MWKVPNRAEMWWNMERHNDKKYEQKKNYCLYIAGHLTVIQEHLENNIFSNRFKINFIQTKNVIIN